MASVIKVKRSSTSNAPSTLNTGELSYSFGVNAKKLYIGGMGTGSDLNANNGAPISVGGEYYTSLIDDVNAGTLTGGTSGKVVIVDSNKKINEWLVGNLTLTGNTNTISSTNTDGNIILDPAGTGLIGLDSSTVRIGTGANATITSNGTYDLILNTNGGTDSGSITIADGADQNISITPNGTGKISLDGQLWPNAAGTNGYFLKTDNNGTLEWAAIPSGSFTIAAESGANQAFTTGNTFTVAAGEGIDTAVSISGSDVTVTVSGEDATTSNKGIASFNSTYFSVTTGAVSINDEYVQDTVGAMVSSNNESNISVTYDDTNGKLDFSVATATTSTLGVASFSTDDFTVSSGAVTIKNVNLGTQTTGNYAADVSITAGTGLSITGSAGEGTSYVLAGVDATTSVKGVASFNSTYFSVTTGAVSINDEYVQDTVGDMVSSNNESNISVTYDDTNGKLDFSVATATTSVLGVASFDTNNFTVTAGAVSTKNITLGSSTLTNGSTTSSLAGLTQLTVDQIDINGTTISATGVDADYTITITPKGNGTVDVSSKRITSVATPTDATDAATKGYVDAVKTGLDVKDSVRLASTGSELVATYNNGTSGVGATLTNAGTQAALQLDSVTVVQGDRVLIKDQTTNPEWNGIYTVTTVGTISTNWVLTRATDFDSAAEVTGGAFTFVEEGSTQSDNGYVVTTNGAITLGTTGITWAQFSGAGSFIAGDGLSRNANTLNVNVDNSTIEINGDNLRLKDAGVTFAKIQNVDGLSVVGNATNASGTADEITAATDHTVLRRSGTSIGFGAIALNQADATSGQLPVNKGGTGASTLTLNGVLYGNGTDAIQATAAGTNGYFLYSNSGVPAWTDTIDGGTY